MAEILAGLKGYVTASDSDRFAGAAEDVIRLDIQHNLLTQCWHDIKFPRCATVADVKGRLKLHGAGNVAGLELYLRGMGKSVFLYDDDKTLADYGAENGMEIFVKDTDPYSLARGGGLEDVSQVTKYTMTDDEYDQRDNTLRNHVRMMRAQNPDFQLFPEGHPLHKAKKDVPERPEPPADVESWVGKRCEVTPGGRRGEVAYVGKVGRQTNERTGQPTVGAGVWVGVALDEPRGSNDGTGANGKRHFECDENKGVYCRPENCNVGEFPVEDVFALLDSDDEV